ncbi:MAG: ABC transporter ATP-binding protein [Acidobacteriota bacterium]
MSNDASTQTAGQSLPQVKLTSEAKVVVQTVDLHMVYKMGVVKVHALRGVSLEVRQGEFVSVMGNSGCGKSTLLHIIGGLLTPTAGKVIVEGHDLSQMSDAERTDLRRREIGFVFQRHNLFPTLTVEGNLKLAERIYDNTKTNSAEDAGRREELLKVLDLEEKTAHKPMELSGGEQQRVALARALINRPAILLADEPTGNLDSEHSETVLTMLRELNQRLGQTVVMITHNPEAASYSSRIVRMKDGTILA